MAIPRVSCRTKAILAGLILIGGAGAISASTSAVQETGSGIGPPKVAGGLTGVEPRADRILYEMGEYLRTAREFTFHADITNDVVSTSGPMVQYGGASDVSVRRPDRLYVD
jgi:hypothetical protein